MTITPFSQFLTCFHFTHFTHVSISQFFPSHTFPPFSKFPFSSISSIPPCLNLSISHIFPFLTILHFNHFPQFYHFSHFSFPTFHTFLTFLHFPFPTISPCVHFPFLKHFIHFHHFTHFLNTDPVFENSELSRCSISANSCRYCGTIQK